MNAIKVPERIDISQREKKVVYTARSHTRGGGRDGGTSRTSDGRLEVRFSIPGTSSNGTNPEQMLAAGWSGCFLSAMGIVANKRKVKLPDDAAVDAEVDLCTGIDGFFLQARFSVSLPGMERHIAQEIVDAAHDTCPYSKALMSNINLVTNLL